MTDPSSTSPAETGSWPIAAIRGAITFLTRIPIPGGHHSDWHAFRTAPWTIPVVGWILGIPLAVLFVGTGLVSIPWPTVSAGYLCLLYVLSGVTHADGLADLGDAIAAHDPDRRRAVLADADLGVGGLLALIVTLFVLVLGVAALTRPATDPIVAARIVLAAEVGAKLGVALAVCLGTAAHDGLGSSLTAPTTIADAVPAVAVALPVCLGVPAGAAPAVLAAVCAGPIVALVLAAWTHSWLGGVSGDVFGAINEIGRALALHAGVIAWTIL